MIWHEWLGAAASIIAVAGVVLNNRRVAWCFPFWLVSNGLTGAIHVSAGIWSLAARDLVFFVLAIEGLRLWKRKKDRA